MSVMEDIIAWELGELGYNETPTNITKYAKELDILENNYLPRQGSPWCGTFQDYGFRKFDALAALPSAQFWTPGAAQAFDRIGRLTHAPKRGMLGYRTEFGAHGHVVMVLDVSYNSVLTVAGNTSGGNPTDGGSVEKHSYAIDWFAGYGMPMWDRVIEVAVPGTIPADGGPLRQFIQACMSTQLQLGDKGPVVKLAQAWLKINQDSIFGNDTLAATVAFQSFMRQAQITKGIIPVVNGQPNPFLLRTDGVIDNHTWAFLQLANS